MIRDAVLHLLNEQPLLVDLPETPTAGDVSLVCTNVRTTAGKRPAFVDRSASTFVFPYTQVRFIELPPAGVAAAGEGTDDGEVSAPLGAAEAENPDLDEDFLRRIREA